MQKYTTMKKSFLYQILKQAKQLVSEIRILVYFREEEGSSYHERTGGELLDTGNFLSLYLSISYMVFSLWENENKHPHAHM